MWSRAGVALLAEYALRRLGRPPSSPPGHPPSNRPERSQPAGGSTTLASEKGAHVGQYGVAQVEHSLKGLESEYGEGKTSGEPFCVGQPAQNFGDGLSAELHRAIGHEEMDGFVGVPDIEAGMQRQQ